MRNSLWLAALAALLASPSFAQSWEPWSQVLGAADGDLLGYSVAPVADVNGDGRDDLLVGAYGADAGFPNSGAVFVYSGASTADVLLEIDGDEAGSLFGAAVADLGDLDGDGISEVAVGAPWHSGTVFFGGRVYIVRGNDGLVLDVVSATGVGDLFGAAVAGVDTDGDGTRELVAGAIGANGGAGEVRIYTWNGFGMGLTGSVAGTTASVEAFGYALASAGDQDGVPGEEFLAGAPFADGVAGTETGRIDLLQGSTVAFSFEGATAGGHLGFSVAGGRDVDGDGWDDLAGGAPDAGAGEVFVWQGGPPAGSPALLKSVSGRTAGDRFGHAVALLEDTSFDGRAELAVGAPEAGGAGLAQVLDLNRSQPRAIVEVNGKTGDMLGFAVCGAGDLDRQGREELALGAPFASLGGVDQRGRVDVWRSLPPDQGGGGNEIRPFRLTLQSGILDERTVVDFLVENYRPGVDLYAYVGTQQVPSTSAEGFPLDISGDGGPLAAFKVVTGVTGSSTIVQWFVPPGFDDGQTLFFQFVESNSNFVYRASNVDQGTIRKPLILDTIGTRKYFDTTDPGVTVHVAHINEPLQLSVRNANPSQDAYFYYSLAGPGSSQANGFDLDIKAPAAWPGSPVKADGNGDALSQTITVPPTVVGKTLWVQAASDAPANPAKKTSNVIPIQLVAAP